MNPFVNFESRNPGAAAIEGAHYRVSLSPMLTLCLPFYTFLNDYTKINTSINTALAHEYLSFTAGKKATSLL